MYYAKSLYQLENDAKTVLKALGGKK
jgi:hypothetical protein